MSKKPQTVEGSPANATLPVSLSEQPSTGSRAVVLERRQALQGLGMLAVSAPALAALSCGSSASGESGTGGAMGFGGATGSGGAMPGSGGAALGSGGSGTGGANGGMPGAGGAANGGMPGAGGAANGGAPGSGGATAMQGSGGAMAGQGAGGNAMGGASGGVAGAQASGGSGGATSGMLTPPNSWDNVPTCKAVSKTDGAGQGPFFIHEKEKDDDVTLYRQDIRGRYNQSAEPGIEMQLHLRILDAKKSMDCGAPVPAANVEVYIWHTDPQGYYSGFGNPGDQTPDAPYAGKPGQNDLDNADRFCRGIQTTNADGVVSFRSTYPGWYNGRDLHIHFVAFKPGSSSRGRVTYSKSNEPNWIFTTQFYFDPAFTRSIHETYQPYKRRTTLSAYAGAILADESGNSGLLVCPDPSGSIAATMGTDGKPRCSAGTRALLTGEVAVVQMQIVLDPS